MAEDIHEIDISEEVAPGAFADFVGVWHTPDTFVFDFAALIAPPEDILNEMGEEITHLQSRIVARVRVPPAQIIEIMKALNHQLDAWEKETGNQPVEPPSSKFSANDEPGSSGNQPGSPGEESGNQPPEPDQPTN